MKQNKLLIKFLLCFLLLSGCRGDIAESFDITQSDIEGKWQVSSALRNGAPTGTLDGAQFTFTQSLFTSNVPGFIFGENNVGEYRLSSDTIYTGILRPAFFTVNHIEENALSISTLIQGYNFVFELERMEYDED